MAQLSGVFRLGRDAELRTTQGGDSVCSLSLAFNYGRKDNEGKRPSQWVEASLWGKRADALAQYLLKGNQVYLVLSDPHIETYQKNGGGEGFKLAATVLEVELISGQVGQAAPTQQQPRQQPAPQRNAYADARGAPQPKSLSDYDDSDPF